MVLAVRMTKTSEPKDEKFGGTSLKICHEVNQKSVNERWDRLEGNQHYHLGRVVGSHFVAVGECFSQENSPLLGKDVHRFQEGEFDDESFFFSVKT